MKTYYIVEHVDDDGDKLWAAHTGLMARLGYFNPWTGCVSGTRTRQGPNDCEEKLRVSLEAAKVQPKIVRVVKI